MMKKRLTSILIIASCTLVAGCMGSDPRANYRGHEAPYQPVVSQNHLVLDLAAGNGGLASGEAGRAQGWFENIGLRYGDRITIDDSNGYGSNAVRNQIASVTGRFGLIPSADPAPPTAGGVQPGMVRIVVSRATAVVDGCPNWDDPIFGRERPGSPNYGCATNSALAQMVADPNDLVRGRSAADAGHDSAYAVQAIEKWRKADVNGAGSKTNTMKSESTGN